MSHEQTLTRTARREIPSVQHWREALSRLSERERLLLCLREDRGLSSERIGAMLGWSAAEVDRRYARAARALAGYVARSAPAAHRPFHPRCLRVRRV